MMQANLSNDEIWIITIHSDLKLLYEGKRTAKKNETKEVLVVHRYGINKKKSIEQHEISDEKSK